MTSQNSMQWQSWDTQGYPAEMAWSQPPRRSCTCSSLLEPLTAGREVQKQVWEPSLTTDWQITRPLKTHEANMQCVRSRHPALNSHSGDKCREALTVVPQTPQLSWGVSIIVSGFQYGS